MFAELAVLPGLQSELPGLWPWLGLPTHREAKPPAAAWARGTSHSTQHLRAPLSRVGYCAQSQRFPSQHFSASHPLPVQAAAAPVPTEPPQPGWLVPSPGQAGRASPAPVPKVTIVPSEHGPGSARRATTRAQGACTCSRGRRPRHPSPRRR